MPIRDFSEDFFGSPSTATRGEETYKSIYERVVTAKPRKQEDIEEISKILIGSIGKAKPPRAIKDPEYFFKFLTLTVDSERAKILGQLKHDMFEKDALLKIKGWILTIGGEDNKDIKDKLVEIFSAYKILPSSLDFAANLDEEAKKIGLEFGAALEKKLSALDLGHSDTQSQGQLSYVKGLSVISDQSPVHTNADTNPLGDILENVTVENRGNGVLEDHLYFDVNGEQLSKEDVPGKETVDMIKDFSRAYHASGVLKNSFLQEKPKEIILDSMKQTGANTSAFVCASDNPTKPNQKVVDCVTFGKPSIRVRLDIRHSDGTKGVLYYYPYEKKLTMLGEDKGEHEVKPKLFPNIVISEPVHYNSLSNEVAQAKSNKVESRTGTETRDEDGNEEEQENDGESSTVTFDGGLKKASGQHSRKALELSARSGSSVDFGIGSM